MFNAGLKCSVLSVRLLTFGGRFLNIFTPKEWLSFQYSDKFDKVLWKIKLYLVFMLQILELILNLVFVVSHKLKERKIILWYKR
jgi:hypothetical protein